VYVNVVCLEQLIAFGRREVKELARAGLRNPASVSVAVRAQAAPSDSGGVGGGHSTVNTVIEKYGVQATPSSLTNYYALASPALKPLILLRFLHEHRHQKVSPTMTPRLH
jgi:hypothetical protein